VAVSRGSLVVAAAIPLLFLHSEFQPSISVAVAGTNVTAYLSDFAVLAVVVCAAAVLARDGFARLAPGRALWAWTAAFFVWLAAELLLGRRQTSTYPLSTHTVTLLKFFEYALLAPALPVLVRTSRDLLLQLWSLTLWSCAATVVGIAEFFGADVAAKGTVGHRQASFLSSADFAALSAAVLLVAAIVLGAPQLRLPRPLGAVAAVSGVLGTIVAGAVASALGIATALVLLAILLVRARLLSARRVALVGAIALVTLGGVATIRGRDLSAFATFLGASKPTPSETSKVQTYPHRTLLAWFGYRIWLDHPVFGVGWEGSEEPANFDRYLAAAHRRFTDVAPTAFPSAAPDRRYGVQDAWLQALADLGVVGLVLWVGVFASALWLALRSPSLVPKLVAAAWIALLVWLWTAQGFIAGIPLDALTWLAFGLAATRVRDA